MKTDRVNLNVVNERNEMIESKRIDSPAEDKPEYPKLMIHVDGEFVVMFTDICRGVVVESNYERTVVGHHSEFWTQQEFKPYTGVVELRNG